MKLLGPLSICIAILLKCVDLPIACADEIDDVVAEQMREKQIPGMSLAILAGGKIIREQGFGFADEARKIPVTTKTLFQAGSISKPVSAVAALHLVDSQQVDLDADVNIKLRSWKVPENEFNK